MSDKLADDRRIVRDVGSLVTAGVVAAASSSSIASSGERFLEGPPGELAELDRPHDALGLRADALQALPPGRLGLGGYRRRGAAEHAIPRVDPDRELLGESGEDDPLDGLPADAEIVRAGGHLDVVPTPVIVLPNDRKSVEAALSPQRPRPGHLDVLPFDPSLDSERLLD